MQPNGIANTTTSIIAVQVNDKFNEVFRKRFKVENVSNRKIPLKSKANLSTFSFEQSINDENV